MGFRASIQNGQVEFVLAQVATTTAEDLVLKDGPIGRGSRTLLLELAREIDPGAELEDDCSYEIISQSHTIRFVGFGRLAISLTPKEITIYSLHGPTKESKFQNFGPLPKKDLIKELQKIYPDFKISH